MSLSSICFRQTANFFQVATTFDMITELVHIPERNQMVLCALAFPVISRSLARSVTFIHILLVV